MCILLRSGAECRGFLVKGWRLNLLFVSICTWVFGLRRESADEAEIFCVLQWSRLTLNILEGSFGSFSFRIFI